MSATTGENVENVAKLLNDDKRYSCDENAHELDISDGSVHRILTERLQMRKIAAQWVPHMLSESEKHQRVNIARNLIKRYCEDGDEMLQRIVAIDETWIRLFEPELKVALQILGRKFFTDTKKSSLYSQSLLIFIHRTPVVERHPTKREIRDLLWPRSTPTGNTVYFYMSTFNPLPDDKF